MPTHTVCTAKDLPVGNMRGFTAGSTKVVVYHLKDGFFATQGSCTHMFAPLAKGKIVGGCQVRCPFHRASFDIRSGEVVEWANFPPGIQLINVLRSSKALKTYKVSLINGDLRVTV